MDLEKLKKKLQEAADNFLRQSQRTATQATKPVSTFINNMNPVGDSNPQQAGNQNYWTQQVAPTIKNISNIRYSQNTPTLGQATQNAWNNNLFQTMAKTNTNVPLVDTVVRSGGQMAGGVFNGASFGTINPVREKPRNILESSANIAGNTMGMFAPISVGSKLLTPIGRSTELAGARLMPKLRITNNLAKRVLPVVAGEAAQTATIAGIRGATNQEFNPMEDLAYGLGVRGVLGQGAKLMGKQAFRMSKDTMEELATAKDRISNPGRFVKVDMNKFASRRAYESAIKVTGIRYNAQIVK